ncbi:hypothetical protein BST36_23390 [Mycolicibacterium moriokaense]|uniref:Cytochrome c oxidase subunit IV n=1 Tax=Mycolicibacterium moriokaense TaxID=39691 RepID=A0AAD1H8E6_9MYCO|nr:cytochrome C oxidase subunit IV family protein [Mycolicibacterium moriokaense]MCV7039176.1 cytochrome C oxidase subunit IV family protein [Mycolicibacterium moriokaense]ORB18540.1 hypothetical protein BST36_23390 [Mycolicibacterium moriokaense]BBX00080.1 hypothetical protein MMOR_10160 [Mycolicibacterium moriokaense]
MPGPAKTPTLRTLHYAVGVALVALTVVGLLLFRILDPGAGGDSALLVDIGVIMGLALIKAYLVGAEYMEIRKSVTWLKAAFGSWLLLTWLSIMITTYLGMHLDGYIHFL